MDTVYILGTKLRSANILTNLTFKLVKCHKLESSLGKGPPLEKYLHQTGLSLVYAAGHFFALIGG